MIIPIVKKVLKETFPQADDTVLCAVPSMSIMVYLPKLVKILILTSI